MSSVAIIVVFSITWWLIFLMLLPIGVRQPDQIEAGHSAGAPEKPMVWKKILWATLASIPATAAILWFIHSGFIPIRGVMK
ncbi:MAG: DUF1467 family protein [Alphaproteobacteria bacterium]|nr:DUF1467 family protein [Alphaproteobacteria bacterium]